MFFLLVWAKKKNLKSANEELPAGQDFFVLS